MHHNRKTSYATSNINAFDLELLRGRGALLVLLVPLADSGLMHRQHDLKTEHSLL